MTRTVARSTSLIAAILFMSTSVFGQDSPATKEEVLQFMETMRLKQGLAQYFDVMRLGMRKGVMEGLKRKMPELTEDQMQAAAKIGDEVFTLMNLDEMMEMMVPLYQKHLTGEDIRAILAFYRTPTGRKLLEKQPIMMQEGAAIGETYMMQKMPELDRLIEQRMQEFLKTLSEKPGKKD
jgi:uncharacterized protein